MSSLNAPQLRNFTFNDTSLTEKTEEYEQTASMQIRFKPKTTSEYSYETENDSENSDVYLPREEVKREDGPSDPSDRKKSAESP